MTVPWTAEPAETMKPSSSAEPAEADGRTAGVPGGGSDRALCWAGAGRGKNPAGLWGVLWLHPTSGTGKAGGFCV